MRNVFGELDGLMAAVCRKHDGSVRHKDCHPIVDIWPTVERTLMKLHEAIGRRLRSTPTTVSPWLCSFTREIPKEVFEVIWKRTIEHNGFGHNTTETAARIKVLITDKRKSIYVFNRMNDEGVLVKKGLLLKKTFAGKGSAEVIVSSEKPMTFSYNKNSEVLSLTCHYGFWNSYGIPQHC